MSGHVGDLSPTQEAALAAFKVAVEDIVNKPEDTDYYYLRWLRARKFDVDKALDMFKNHMAVRAEYGLDTILEDWTPPEIMKYSPGGFFGEDREGHPVWYDKIGRLDLKGFYRSVRKDDVVKAKLAQLERRSKICKEQSEKHGKVIETVILVLDFEGITLPESPVLAWNGSSQTGPSIFPLLYNIVKPMMDEKTRAKIKVLGSNWREELQQHIAPEQLPQEYGGTRCEPDPECTDYIRPGGEIPERYFLANMTSHSKEEMESTLVNRGGSHTVTMEITAPGSMLKWEFLTESYDIGFGIKLDGTELVSVERKQCDVFPESGSYLCEQTGTYCVIFDNSYSWTRSKQLHYSLEVIPQASIS